MKNKYMKTAARIIFGLIAIASAQLFVSAQEIKNESPEDSTEKSSNRSIVGTRQTSVTPRNCQTGT